ncbi:leucine-rich repeat domain-containing protein [Leptospira santarosai]
MCLLLFYFFSTEVKSQNEKAEEKIYRDLREAFQNPSDVHILSLSNQEIKSLPRQIANLKNLRELDLGYNQLTTLPKEIGKLQCLYDLDLKENPLSVYEKKRIQKWFPAFDVDFE